MVAIRKVECPTNRIAVKCPYEMTPTRVVIHNTGNDASANNEISYMHRNGNTVSFHFAVDDKEIVQGIDLNRNAFHASDGKNGKGNREGIAIEICYSKSGGERFEKAQKNAAELTAKLLKDYGWGIDKVTKHEDYSDKHCPHRTLDQYGWEFFIGLVKGYMTDTAKETVEKSGNLPVLPEKGYFSKGDKGEQVRVLQSFLNSCVGANLVVDGDFGTKTDTAVRNYQEKYGLTVDGKFGKKSLEKAKTLCDNETSGYTGTFPTLPKRGYFTKGDKGESVKRLQSFLNWCINAGLTVDGDFGAKTDTAVRAYQKKYGLTVDGDFGKKSLAKAKTIKK